MVKRKPDVLVVDDEPSITEFLRFALSKDYDVRQAHDVYEALLAIGLCTPDIVVTDLEMDGGGGKCLLAALADDFPTVLRIVHSAAPTSDLARLLVSGLAHAAVSKSGCSAGLADEMRRLLFGELTTPASPRPVEVAR